MNSVLFFKECRSVRQASNNGGYDAIGQNSSYSCFPWACGALIGVLCLSPETAQQSIGWVGSIVHWRMTVVNPEFAAMKRATRSRVVRTICFEKIIIAA